MKESFFPHPTCAQCSMKLWRNELSLRATPKEVEEPPSTSDDLQPSTKNETSGDFSTLYFLWAPLSI